MRFFFLLIACGKEAVSGTFRTCCPTAHSHTRGLILSASDGIWNMLFSTFSHTSRWVRFRFGGCLSLVVAHVRPTHYSPFRVLRTSLMLSQPGFVSASPLGSTSTAVCCASLTSNSSPADDGRDSFYRVARHPATHQAVLRPAELHRVHTAAGPSEVAKHFAEFFLEVESNCEHVILDSSTSVLRQLLLSFVLTAAAQNADSPQHRTAGWRFIDWNEEQRELLAKAKRLLETGELFPRGTAEEPHAPDAEAEATDSEPEAHVMEPLADDHSSDSDDAHTGVEKSAAPAVAAAPKRAAMSLLQRLQAIRIIHGSTPPS